MAKKSVSDVPKFYQDYNAAGERVRFAASLEKPAFGRITDVPGYENILWGGRTAINLAYNLQKTYQNMVLEAAYAGGYRPSKMDLGVAAQIEEARKEGKVPEAMREMTPAAWRSVIENLPLAKTEGGRGISVGGMINLIEGLADAAMGRNTQAALNTMQYIGRFAAIAPQYAQHLPAARVAEGKADEARAAMHDEMMAAMSAVG